MPKLTNERPEKEDVKSLKIISIESIDGYSYSKTITCFDYMFCNCKITQTKNGFLIETEDYCFELYNAEIKRIFYEKTT